MMRVAIRELTFECILGILEHERIRPQRVIVDALIEYEYIAGTFIDYASVAERIKAVMTEAQFGLVEEALETVSEVLKAEFSAINTLTLTISKPDILPDCRVCVTKKSNF